MVVVVELLMTDLLLLLKIENNFILGCWERSL